LVNALSQNGIKIVPVAIHIITGRVLAAENFVGELLDAESTLIAAKALASGGWADGVLVLWCIPSML
jgi:hypothetical protein